jgi:predicted DNA-binding transcriptional regulator AlpA
MTTTTVLHREIAAVPPEAEGLAAALAPAVARLLADHLRLEVMLGDDVVLSTAEAARIIGVSGKTLELWRSQGSGPRWINIGPRGVAYRVGDLRAYVQSRPANGRRAMHALLGTPG